MDAHVLIVDDEVRVTKAIQRTLHRERFKIHTATSARVALEILSEQPIDVVVSDGMMPGMSGTDFLAVVRRSQER